MSSILFATLTHHSSHLSPVCPPEDEACVKRMSLKRLVRHVNRAALGPPPARFSEKTWPGIPLGLCRLPALGEGETSEKEKEAEEKVNHTAPLFSLCV